MSSESLIGNYAEHFAIETFIQSYRRHRWHV